MDLVWNRIITLNHDDQVVLNPVRFDPTNGIVIEEYDLEGMMVFGQATNWAPFRVCMPCNIRIMIQIITLFY